MYIIDVSRHLGKNSNNVIRIIACTPGMGQDLSACAWRYSKHFLWSVWLCFQTLDLFKYLCLSSDTNHIGFEDKHKCFNCTRISLTTVHAMTKSFVLFCSVKDGESTDINCLVFWAHGKNGKICTKCQV